MFQGETAKDHAAKSNDQDLAAYLESRQHYQMIQREDQETAVWTGSWSVRPPPDLYQFCLLFVHSTQNKEKGADSLKDSPVSAAVGLWKLQKQLVVFSSVSASQSGVVLDAAALERPGKASAFELKGLGTLKLF